MGQEIPVNPVPASSSPATARAGPVRTSIARAVAGLALLVGLTTTGGLTARHFTQLELPGCSNDGPCAEAEAGRWGKVAGWPVTFLGFAYFAALATAWPLPRTEPPSSLLPLIRP